MPNSEPPRFVGVDAYEAAGGAVMRDLFARDDESGVWFGDPAGRLQHDAHVRGLAIDTAGIHEGGDPDPRHHLVRAEIGARRVFGYRVCF